MNKKSLFKILPVIAILLYGSTLHAATLRSTSFNENDVNLDTATAFELTITLETGESIDNPNARRLAAELQVL